MDPFDDFLSEAPVSRARVGGRFIPKAKAKQPAPKEISTSNQATSSNDGKNEQVVSSSMSSDTVGNVLTKSSNPVDSTPDKSASEFLKSSHSSPVPVLDSNNPDLESSQQINVSGCNAALVEAQPSIVAASEADPVGFDVGLVVDTVLETDLHNANSTIIENEERSEYREGEGPFLDGKKSLEPVDSSLQVGPDVESQSASDCKVSMMETSHSNSNLERAREVESAEVELDPFRDTLPDPGCRNARKFQPKIKPRPRLGTSAVVASASSNDMLGTINTSSDTNNSCSRVPLPGDKRSLATVLSSRSEPSTSMLSEVAVHNEPRDWPSNSEKPAGETTDIFSVLETFSLDDFLTQDGSSAGNPTLHSFHEKGTEDFVTQACDISQMQKFPNYTTTHNSLTFKEDAVLNEDDSHTENGRLGAEELGGSMPAHPLDDTLDYSSMNNGSDPTFPVCEEPLEEPTSTANNPTYDDLLHVEDIPEGKDDGGYEEKDATMSSSPKNCTDSSVVGETDKVDKPRRQGRKRVNLKHVDPAENEDPEEEDELDLTYSNIDELEELDDEYGLNNGCMKKKKKSVSKIAKPRQKRKRANEDLEKATKEPRKKFSHSTQRRKRCVDKALLEIPEDELNPQTLRIKDIILLAEYRERQVKKEAAASKTSSINGRDGDSLHKDSAHNEDMLGSEYGRGSDDDQANENVPLAPTLFNYQSFMDRKPRGKWSKQDTELFFGAVRQFGTDFSMIQQLFPDRTRHQIKLKYKQEERQHPLLLSDAINNRPKDLSHFKMVFELLQQASAKTEQDISDTSVGMTEESVDLTSDPNPNEGKDAKPDQDEAVQDHQEDNEPSHSAEKSNENEDEDEDDDDDDFQRWCQYKSDY
ncbi:hypothetical protein QN277_009068 [Acacia crassicarpa]|uniref:SANT domain-containing protein n=1 Tax=Acacia crassicarpa TaxID=499986 RepID=A0AAE1IU62_9FABA|nr:hypothetical protein QN277_009068 [Acacia crassicarpa]